jgi:hypothetical protein
VVDLDLLGQIRISLVGTAEQFLSHNFVQGAYPADGISLASTEINSVVSSARYSTILAKFFFKLIFDITLTFINNQHGKLTRANVRHSVANAAINQQALLKKLITLYVILDHITVPIL